MEEIDRLKEFGLPVKNILMPSDKLDKDLPYTVVNISEMTVVLANVLPSGNRENITLNPFGFVNCATSLTGNIINSLSIRQFWMKGYLAVFSGDLDTSFLLNCVPLGTPNPYSKPFFDPKELKYESPAEAVSDAGMPIDPKKIEKVAEPLAEKIKVASMQGSGRMGTIEISGKFRPENADEAKYR